MDHAVQWSARIYPGDNMARMSHQFLEKVVPYLFVFKNNNKQEKQRIIQTLPTGSVMSPEP